MKNLKRISSKIVVVLAIGAMGFGGCASTAPAKKGAYVALAAAKEGLNLVSTTLLQVECGKPTAPIAPACVPSDVADQAWKAIGVAADAGEQATVLVRALPANLDSATPPAEISNLIGKVWEAIWKVAAIFHKDAAPEINKDLSNLAHQ